MAVARKTKRAEKPEGFCAYIGPSIRGVIHTGTIYAMPRQEALKSPALVRALRDYPAIAELIVSGESLSEARNKIKTPGTLLFMRYKALAAAGK